jgi:beta-mannosidase
MYFRTLLSYFLACQALPIASQSVIALDGSAWSLTNHAKNISVPATVPGSVHLDLQRAEVIENPYYGNLV